MWGRSFHRRRLSSRSAVLFAVGVGVLAGMLGVVPVRSQTMVLEVRQAAEAVAGDEPWAAVWDGAPSQAIPMSEQTVAPPFGGGAIASLTARALHDGDRLYFLLEWADSEPNDSVNAQEAFSDAVAVQFPGAEGTLPPYTMGAPEAPVNIWQWKAVWQRDIDEEYVTSRDRYPETYVDSYPNEDESIYNPARHLGNALAQLDHVSPIENLVAAGFGSLTPAEVQDVEGAGEWRDGRWRALFVRNLDSSADGMARFAVDESTTVAFAVWDGGQGDRNGQKSVAEFIELDFSMEAAPPIVAPPLEPGDDGGFSPATFLIVFLGVVALFWGLAEWTVRRAGRS